MSKLTDLIRPVVLLNGVTGLTGGGATKLDGIATTSLTVGLRGFVVVSEVVYFYELQAGTDAESAPTVIRPDDYAGGTNEKVWQLLALGGSGGGAFVLKAGDTMTGALTLSGDPASALHAATKQYVDAVATGLDVKASCRAATTANITLSGEQTIDGVSVVAGDRVLVKNQSTGSENGIYVVAVGSWSRATDADASAEVTSGLFCFVTEGTTNGDVGFVLTTNDPITVGSTSLTFAQFSKGLADGEVTDAKLGNRTIDDTDDPTNDADTLTKHLSALAYQVKVITGKPGWKTAPDVSLAALATRYRNLYVDAGAMVARTTSGATAATDESSTNKIITDHFLFDGTTAEYVTFKVAMPDDWDRGTIKVKVFWGAATSGSGGVAWSIKAGALSDDDAIDTALGTAVVVTDTVLAVGDMHVSAASGALTVGGSPALGDMICFEIQRDPSNGSDTMSQDAKLFGLQIQYRESSTLPSAW